MPLGAWHPGYSWKVTLCNGIQVHFWKGREREPQGHTVFGAVAPACAFPDKAVLLLCLCRALHLFHLPLFISWSSHIAVRVWLDCDDIRWRRWTSYCCPSRKGSLCGWKMESVLIQSPSWSSQMPSSYSKMSVPSYKYTQMPLENCC